MIKKMDGFLEAFSKWGIVICISLMLSLTLLNISLRWFQVSILWIEPLVRHLVFIGAFLGGSLATGNRHHIKIDLIGRLLEKSTNRILPIVLDKIITIVTLIATLILVYSSYNLVLVEFEYGKNDFLGIHTGFLISIIPVGTILISLRLILRLFIPFEFKKAKVS